MKNLLKKFMKQESGFTLIEIIVATTVFVIGAVIFMGVFTTISNISMRVESLRFAQQDARYAIEQSSREIRNGWNFELVGIDGDQLLYENDDGRWEMAFVLEGETGDPYRPGGDDTDLQGVLVRRNVGVIDPTEEKLTSSLSDIEEFKFEIIEPPGDYAIVEITMVLKRSDFERFADPIELSTRVTSRRRDKESN